MKECKSFIIGGSQPPTAITVPQLIAGMCADMAEMGSWYTRNDDILVLDIGDWSICSEYDAETGVAHTWVEPIFGGEMIFFAEVELDSSAPDWFIEQVRNHEVRLAKQQIAGGQPVPECQRHDLVEAKAACIRDALRHEH